MTSDYVGIRVIGEDREAVAQVRGLLEFVGEPVREDITDVVMLVAAGDGRWPRLPVQPDAVICVGEGRPPEMSTILACLRPPLRLEAVLECLSRVHAFRRDRNVGNGSCGGMAFTGVIGVSQAMARVRLRMSRVRTSDVPVLLVGEAGTGKETVARALHECSPWQRGAFVPVRCSAVAPELLASELFGHEKGALPGAVSARPGRLELAAGGTLFLDDVDQLPVPLQTRLHRAMVEGTFEREGEPRARRSVARIIAATTRDLGAATAAGAFRQDLYFRLDTCSISLPPLRERAQDIAPLVHALTAHLAAKGRQVRLSPDAIRVLEKHTWPGNVRELNSLLERLALEFPGQVVTSRELPPQLGEQQRQESSGAAISESLARLPVNGLDLKEFLGRLERSLIEQALEEADSVVARAADRLHVRRTTLVEKMRKYGIVRPEPAPLLDAPGTR